MMGIVGKSWDRNVMDPHSELSFRTNARGVSTRGLNRVFANAGIAVDVLSVTSVPKSHDGVMQRGVRATIRTSIPSHKPIGVALRESGVAVGACRVSGPGGSSKRGGGCDSTLTEVEQQRFKRMLDANRFKMFNAAKDFHGRGDECVDDVVGKLQPPELAGLKLIITHAENEFRDASSHEMSSIVLAASFLADDETLKVVSKRVDECVMDAFFSQTSLDRPKSVSMVNAIFFGGEDRFKLDEKARVDDYVDKFAIQIESAPAPETTPETSHGGGASRKGKKKTGGGSVVRMSLENLYAGMSGLSVACVLGMSNAGDDVNDLYDRLVRDLVPPSSVNDVGTPLLKHVSGPPSKFWLRTSLPLVDDAIKKAPSGACILCDDTRDVTVDCQRKSVHLFGHDFVAMDRCTIYHGNMTHATLFNISARKLVINVINDVIVRNAGGGRR